MGKPSKRREQKALAHQKAKRRAAPPLRSPLRLPSIPADAPVYECQIPKNLFKDGMGNVMIARELPSGELAMAMCLLDVFCLGVKDLACGVVEVPVYHRRTHFTTDGSYEAISPANLRALVEGAVEYARQLGLPPHPDYPNACRIFAGIDPLLADRVFTYGSDGKPLYISGPHDTKARSRQILAALERACGPGGFDFMLFVDGDEEE